MGGWCHVVTCMNLSPVCERVNWNCAPECPVTLLDVYCTVLYICFPFSTPLYTPALPVLIYLFVLYHCMCFVIRPKFPHETLTYPGPACSKDIQTDNVPTLGTDTYIAAQKGRWPEGSEVQKGNDCSYTICTEMLLKWHCLWIMRCAVQG